MQTSGESAPRDRECMFTVIASVGAQAQRDHMRTIAAAAHLMGIAQAPPILRESYRRPPSLSILR